MGGGRCPGAEKEQVWSCLIGCFPRSGYGCRATGRSCAAVASMPRMATFLHHPGTHKAHHNVMSYAGRTDRHRLPQFIRDLQIVCSCMSPAALPGPAALPEPMNLQQELMWYWGKCGMPACIGMFTASYRRFPEGPWLPRGPLNRNMVRGFRRNCR